MTDFDRRQFLLNSASIGATAGMLPALPLIADEPTKSGRTRERADLMDNRTRKAIKDGLNWLGRRQITRARMSGAFGTSGYPAGVAVAGLAGLAFMCGGSPPGRGPHGKHVERCIDYLVKNTDDRGYISVSTRGGYDRMYGHGFATLFLSEAFGMGMHEDKDKALGKKLRLAVKLIVDTQNDHGGWRYQPVKSDADLSITICQIMGLRGARDAGILVPEKTRKKCIEYVKKSQNADGGFRYTINGGGSTFPLTAAGVVALNSAGIYEGPEVSKGLKWLMKYIPSSISGGYYFYGQYYAVQAMWHAGGDYWKKWYTAIRGTLLKGQSGDGSWRDPSVGAEFGTAMACIILAIPNNYVPVFTEGLSGN